MGAFQGNLTYKLFFVEGDLPDSWKDHYLAQIDHLKFEPLTPESDADESMGWVEIERPLRSDFMLSNVVYNDFINLGFRRDKYSIPSALLKAHLSEAFREYREQNQKERLTKFEKDDIKTLVQKRLREQSLPAMKVVDMSWEMSTGRVRFWSQSNSLCELFQEYWEDTFDLRLIPANPYIYGLQFNLGDIELERLATVEPSNFVDGRMAME